MSGKPLCIRLLRKGCTNRPFYHIIAIHPEKRCVEEGIEQLGVYDPMPNENNERLISLNIDRFKRYVAEGAWVRSTVAMLLGTAGVLPIHPHCFILSLRRRRLLLKQQEEKQKSEASEKLDTSA